MLFLEKQGSLNTTLNVGAIAILAAFVAPAVITTRNEIDAALQKKAIQSICTAVGNAGVFPQPSGGTPEAESLRHLLGQSGLDEIKSACPEGEVTLTQKEIAVAVLQTEAQADRQIYPSRSLVADASEEAIEMLYEADHCQSMPEASPCLDALHALAFARAGKPVPSALLERMLAALPAEKSH